MLLLFFFSSRRRHTRCSRDWSSDVCSSDLMTLANRDQIFGDDNVQILLGTFHDGKQALMFAVNPLGVQGDGTLIEGANVTASGFIGGGVVGREQPHLSPAFVYQSRRRATAWGYEGEGGISFQNNPDQT